MIGHWGRGRLPAGFLCLVLTACTQITVPEKIEVVEDTIFVKAYSTRLVPIPGVSTSGAGQSLMISNDRGGNWSVRAVPDLLDFAFLTPTKGYLVVAGGLEQTLDGGSTRSPVPAVGENLTGIHKIGASLAAFGDRSLHLSFDSGMTWAGQPLPPLGKRDGLRKVAWGDGRLAVSTRRGRVFLINLESNESSEWIVGGIEDLAYHEGRFYGLTTMATVAVLDGRQIQHISLELDELQPRRFATFDGLYFHTDSAVYKIAGESLHKVAQISDAFPEGQMARDLALISPRQALVTMWPMGGFKGKVHRLDFDSLRLQELGELP